MIILEGPDGAGKTTLCEKLQDEFGLVVGIRGTKDRTQLYKYTVTDTFRAIRGCFEFGTPPVLWDRLYYSELVYYLYRPVTEDSESRLCQFNGPQRAFVERTIEAVQCPVILCLPPEEVVLANVLQEDRQEMEGIKENITKIYHRYEKLWLSLIFPPQVTSYDYTKPDAERGVFETVSHYLLTHKERAA